MERGPKSVIPIFGSTCSRPPPNSTEGSSPRYSAWVEGGPTVVQACSFTAHSYLPGLGNRSSMDVALPWCSSVIPVIVASPLLVAVAPVIRKGIQLREAEEILVLAHVADFPRVVGYPRPFDP